MSSFLIILFFVWLGWKEASDRREMQAALWRIEKKNKQGYTND